jgi:hypothetical protein
MGLFGNNIEALFQANKEGKEFFIPIGGQGFSIRDIQDHKVSKVSVSDFLKSAKARFRKRNPIAPNQADYVNWILYDRISFAPDTTINQLFKLFVTPIGTNSKTKVDTNLDQTSQLDAPQWFNATGLSVYLNPNIAPVDFYNFFATEYLEFWVSQKVYVEGPLDCFPGSGGFVNSSSYALYDQAAPTSAYVSTSTNGWPSVHNMFDLRLPAGLPLGNSSSGQAIVADGIIGVTILQSQTFNVQFKADGGGASLAADTDLPINGVGLTVNVRLSGILSRGVQ